MSVKRFDTGRLDKSERTPQGGLCVPAFPTRAGVLVYLNADGTERRELRPPEEVFKPESLRSMHGAPVTDLHPKDAVTPENWRTLSVGHVAEEVKRDGEHVSAPLLIQDANMIRMVESRERQECSCGYSCDIDLTSGVYQGQPYDVVQRNIVYNHVALGPADWGRAGPTVALRLDSGDAVEIKQPKKPAEKVVMALKVRVDGIEYEAGTDSYLQAVERRDSQQRARIAELETSNAALTKEKDTEKGRADALEKSNKDLKEKLKTATDPKTIHAAAKTRADMLDKCRRAHRLNGLRFDEVAAEAGSVEEMLLSAVKAMDPNFDPNGKSPDYVRAAFEILFSQMIARAGGAEGAEGEGEPEMMPEGEGEPPPGAPLDGSGGGVPPRQDSRGTDIYAARRGTGNRQDGGKKDDPNDPDAAYRRMLQDNKDRGTRPLRGSTPRK